MTQDQFTQQDPTRRYDAPGSGEQTVAHPGRTGEMDKTPDHGEETYRGSGRLQGKKTLVTAAGTLPDARPRSRIRSTRTC